MNHFEYRDGVLHAEDVPLDRIAAEVGTPVYVYSAATIGRHLRVFRDAFAPRPPGLFYAVKANANLSVLRLVAQAGCGADTVSEGEIRKAMAAGIPAERIVFSGVGKTEAELGFAVGAGIHQINVETTGELDVLAGVARAAGRRAPVVFRVNPGVGAGAHDKITTGSDDDKFGVSFDDIEGLYRRAAAMAGIEPLGLAVHIGSQILDLAPMRRAFERLRGLADRLRGAGLLVRRIDLGGGLGVAYADRDAMSEGPVRVERYAAMVQEVFAGFDADFAVEPGRLIVANAGVLVARVTGFNERRSKTFAVLDAGMNDLVRPAMYDSYHAIVPVRAPDPAGPAHAYDVVGPICESSDRFAANRTLSALSVGDLVAFLSAGAYGASMSSTYNLRPLVPEVLVSAGRFAVVRPRQGYDALIAQDRVAPWLG